LEYLLSQNPYCFRHSAITEDSDHLPEYAVKKKARWVMNSQQGRRYIKNRMGDELRYRILEHCGIKVAAVSRMVSRTCGRCGYVNKRENKYCERIGCNYPLTQLALDEIKAAEHAKLQELVDKSNLERDNTIQSLQQELKSWGEIAEKMKIYVDRQKKEEEQRRVMYDILDKRSPGWKEPFHATLRRPFQKKSERKLMIPALPEAVSE